MDFSLIILKINFPFEGRELFALCNFRFSSHKLHDDGHQEEGLGKCLKSIACQCLEIYPQILGRRHRNENKMAIQMMHHMVKEIFIRYSTKKVPYFATYNIHSLRDTPVSL